MRGTVARRLRQAAYGDLSQKHSEREYLVSGARESTVEQAVGGWDRLRREVIRTMRRLRIVRADRLRVAGAHATYKAAKRAHKAGRAKAIRRWPKQPRRSWAEVQAAWEKRKRRP